MWDTLIEKIRPQKFSRDAKRISKKIQPLRNEKLITCTNKLLWKRQIINHESTYFANSVKKTTDIWIRKIY